MLDYERKQIEKALNTVDWAGRRVLVKDCYEGYELRKLKEALTFLLEEAEKK